MRIRFVAIVSILACGSTVSAPAHAQREMYEPQYEIAFERLGRVSEQVQEIDGELGQATDVENGCRLLNASLEQYVQAKDLLEDLILAADRLDWDPQKEDAENRLALVEETIGLRENDIATYCTAQ